MSNKPIMCFLHKTRRKINRPRLSNLTIHSSQTDICLLCWGQSCQHCIKCSFLILHNKSVYFKHAVTQPFKETDYTIIAFAQTNNLENIPNVHLTTMKNTQNHYSIQTMYSPAQFRPKLNREARNNGITVTK